MPLRAAGCHRDRVICSNSSCKRRLNPPSFVCVNDTNFASPLDATRKMATRCRGRTAFGASSPAAIVSGGRARNFLAAGSPPVPGPFPLPTPGPTPAPVPPPVPGPVPTLPVPGAAPLALSGAVWGTMGAGGGGTGCGGVMTGGGVGFGGGRTTGRRAVGRWRVGVRRYDTRSGWPPPPPPRTRPCSPHMRRSVIRLSDATAGISKTKNARAWRTIEMIGACHRPRFSSSAGNPTGGR